MIDAAEEGFVEAGMIAAAMTEAEYAGFALVKVMRAHNLHRTCAEIVCMAGKAKRLELKVGSMKRLAGRHVTYVVFVAQVREQQA